MTILKYVLLLNYLIPFCFGHLYFHYYSYITVNFRTTVDDLKDTDVCKADVKAPLAFSLFVFDM